MKRILFIFCAIVVGSVSAIAEDISVISTAQELAEFASAVNGGNSYEGKVIQLKNDIDLPAHSSWTPIGIYAYSRHFKGTFDGQGHKISNLRVNASANTTGYVAGLFGVIGTGGKVKDLTVTSVEVRIDKGQDNDITCYVGAIAGLNGGTIEGCANRGVSVYGNWNSAIVGGIAGENTGTIQNCYNLGFVYTGSNYTRNYLGGIAGENTGTIQNCFVRATIEDHSSNGSIGKITANNGGTVEGCFYMDGTRYDVPPSGSGIISLVNASTTNSTTIRSNLGSNKNILLEDRIIYSDEAWNTFCVPFSIPAGATGYFPIAGATVMELDPTDSNFNSSTGALKLNFKNATTIEAGKPYIIKWDEAIEENLSNPVFLGVTVEEKSEAERAVTSNDKYVTFQGIFDAYSIAGEDKTILYLGNGNTLYYPNDNMTIGACRAYFKLNSSASVKSCVINFNQDNEETGITTTTFTDTADKNDTWYDLQGRKVSMSSVLPKGVYIHKGRKVIINK